MMFRFLTTAFIISLMLPAAYCQEAVPPRASPLASIQMKYKDAYIKIVYSQPHKRGREVFGKLVPFGEVWRTGANEATEMTLTKDIIINDQVLRAGTYSLYTIPQPDKWTIIINSEIGLWGAYNYNEKLDVMRFDLPAEVLADVVYEPFTLEFNQRNELADLLLYWDRTKLTIPLKFIN